VTSFAFLVNPVSGGGVGPTAAEAVAAPLRAAGHEVDVTPTTDAAQTAALVDRGVARGQVIVSVGGDGMLSSVAGAVAAAGGVLGIVPAGRGNDFARMLELSRDPADVAATLGRGTVREVDLIRVQVPGQPERFVVGSAYSGLDSRAGALVDKLRWMPAPLQYPTVAIYGIATYRASSFHLVADGEAFDVFGSSVVIANSAYYGGGMKIAPSAVVDDGWLDIVAMEVATRRRLLAGLQKVYKGEHTDLPEVLSRRAKRVEITGSPDVLIAGDGEEIGRLPALGEPPAVAEVVLGALRILT